MAKWYESNVKASFADSNCCSLTKNHGRMSTRIGHWNSQSALCCWNDGLPTGSSSVPSIIFKVLEFQLDGGQADLNGSFGLRGQQTSLAMPHNGGDSCRMQTWKQKALAEQRGKSAVETFRRCRRIGTTCLYVQHYYDHNALTRDSSSHDVHQSSQTSRFRPTICSNVPVRNAGTMAHVVLFLYHVYF